MAEDRFRLYSESLDGPISKAFAVTPNDNADLSEVTRALYVGGAGSVKVRFKNGGDITYINVSAGQRLPVRVERVFATGTTATNIIAEV